MHWPAGLVDKRTILQLERSFFEVAHIVEAGLRMDNTEEDIEELQDLLARS